MFRALFLVCLSALIFSGCGEDRVYQRNDNWDPVMDWAEEEPEQVERNEPAPTEPTDPQDPPRNEPEDNQDGDPPKQPQDPPEDDCEDTSDLIYVIDRAQKALYLYDPANSEFELLGDLDCGPFAGSPASMSVSRQGIAYVRYADETVYAVDLESMACRETVYESDFGKFGMGFATVDAQSWQDELFVANRRQLARLDTSDWSMTTIGTLPSQSELTGNARGQLWAMLPLENPAQLVHLDKTNARILQRHHLRGFPHAFEIDTFAFATWGGDFYLFVRVNGMGNTTTVYRVSPTGQLTIHHADTGRDVVGAGVSTCSPSSGRR